ncbi:hypothetical protein EBR78_00455 [bacterium]|nr:hypothetical protein [bacterium]NBX83246.1 hypothetical protein [bacterium]
MRRTFWLISLLFIGTSSAKALETVPYVDLNQYLGTWYEIASFPMFFQRGCVATKATYIAREDGRIDVLNECRKESFNGPLKQAKGIARVEDPKTNAKLKVKFFLFWGDYWIIDLDSEYQYAVVSEPRQKYLWILSRRPILDEKTYLSILERLKDKGFDLSKLKLTPQPLP